MKAVGRRCVLRPARGVLPGTLLFYFHLRAAFSPAVTEAACRR